MSLPENDTPDPQPRALRLVKMVVGFLLAQWLIIGFAIACVLGYFFPCKSWDGASNYEW